MKTRSSILVTFFLFVMALAASGQYPTNKVDAFVAAEMERNKIPGVSLAVVKDGKPIIVKGYGLANIEHQVPVKPETIFQSGSIGKQFTAFAVMLLVEEGKIGLDEKIGKYLGEVPPTWSNITIRRLLTHTGGMTDYPENFDFRKDYTEEELLKIAKDVPTAFPPGEKWAYSNLGYVTLGIIIGKVSGKFYGDFLKERVFTPLGMKTARVISERDIVANRAAGYTLRDGQIQNQGWVSPTINTTADGSLYLSVLDMIRWEEGLAGRKLLTNASYQQMWTPVRLNNGREQKYGFGWALRKVNGIDVIEHGGAWQGFKSFIARYPSAKLTVIAFANSRNTNPARLANGVAQIVDPSLKPKPIVDPNKKLTEEMHRLFEAALKGNVDESRFTGRVRQALLDPNDRLIADLKTMGPITSFELLGFTDMGDDIVYSYKAAFASMTVEVEVGLGKDGKIGHLEIHPE